MPPRAVMDTNILYAALRSRRGASFQVLDALWRREWTLVLSNTVLTEYEEILKRESAALGLTLERINKLLDALCSLADRRHLSESWLPVLTDPDDESLVHLSVEAQAGRLVTHNIRHLAPARKLGVTVLEPKEFLAILRT
ncbi:MAG TPA: putative toxin-antitoxin system toxin component, PIN family [Verrucomicrobiae bacterium]